MSSFSAARCATPWMSPPCPPFHVRAVCPSVHFVLGVGREAHEASETLRVAQEAGKHAEADGHANNSSLRTLKRQFALSKFTLRSRASCSFPPSPTLPRFLILANHTAPQRLHLLLAQLSYFITPRGRRRRHHGKRHPNSIRKDVDAKEERLT